MCYYKTQLFKWEEYRYKNYLLAYPLWLQQMLCTPLKNIKQNTFKNTLAYVVFAYRHCHFETNE